MTKPPYRVPSMAEIAAVPWNGLRVLSTFSGCGGSCLGFKMAGFRVVRALEFVEAARLSYAANFPETPIDGRDIRLVSVDDVLAQLGLRAGELDVLEGSPPCASFSTAGKREGAWGKVKKYSDREQRSDDLFFEFARLLDGVKPRAFVAENVSGLVKGKAKGYFLEILAKLKSCGYRVGARLLDAKWLGVPQSRQRLIFVGFREDLGIDPVHPAPLPYQYTLRDALPNVARARSQPHGPNSWDTAPLHEDAPAPTVSTTPNGAGYYHHDVARFATLTYGKIKEHSLDEPSPTVMAGGIGGSSRTQAAISSVPIPDGTSAEEREQLSLEGCEILDRLGPVPPAGDGPSFADCAIAPEFDRLAPGEGSRKYLNLIRADVNKPSPTVTAIGGGRGTASVTHPFERRKFTIAELRRICGFPDDFQLVGKYEQQWERLGRAVPPVMMAHVASAVRDALLRSPGQEIRGCALEEDCACGDGDSCAE